MIGFQSQLDFLFFARQNQRETEFQHFVFWSETFSKEHFRSIEQKMEMWLNPPLGVEVVREFQEFKKRFQKMKTRGQKSKDEMASQQNECTIASIH